jgi:hypothetical protein
MIFYWISLFWEDEFPGNGKSGASGLVTNPISGNVRLSRFRRETVPLRGVL